MFITGSDLTIEDVYNIAVNKQQVSLSESAKAAIISAHQTVTFLFYIKINNKNHLIIFFFK